MKLLSLLLHEMSEIIQMILRFCPGRIGGKLRVWYVRSRYRSIGKNMSVSFGAHVTGEGELSAGDNVSLKTVCELHIKKNGTLSMGSNVGIGRNVYIGIGSGGQITIGNDVMIGPNVVMRSGDHKFENLEFPMNKQGHRENPIVVGNDVWIGANVVVTSGVTIGSHSIVGAGAVVTNDVEPYSIVGGVPARLIRKRK